MHIPVFDNRTPKRLCALLLCVVFMMSGVSSVALAEGQLDAPGTQEVLDLGDSSVQDEDVSVVVDSQEEPPKEESFESLPDQAGSTDAEGQEDSQDVEQGDAEQAIDVVEHPLEMQVLDASILSVSYQAYVQRIGWQSAVKDGDSAGTTGRSLRVEALKLTVVGEDRPSGSIQYRSHVQSVGWQSWVSDGQMSGTSGRSLRVEALQVRLTGELAEQYDLYYRVHVQGIGWMAWAENGELAGTSGQSRRIEAIQVQLVEKGNHPKEDFSSATSESYRGTSGLRVQTHVQGIGWQSAVGSGATAGTTGRGLRVEALKLSVVGASCPGGIRYATHVQGIGWQGWSGNGAVAGTTGQGRRVEAIKAELTGELAQRYDLWYRVHVQRLGWMEWAQNGAPSGTEGLSARIEAVQFVLVDKNGTAPSTGASFNAAFVSPSTVSYAACVEGGGWKAAVSSGTAGTTGASKALTGFKLSLGGGASALVGSVSYDLAPIGGDWLGWASDGTSLSCSAGVGRLKIKLSGDVGHLYSIWYRVHLGGSGWLGWAKNGQVAGSSFTGATIEAVEVKLVPCLASPPGANVAFFWDSLSGDRWLDNYVWSTIQRNAWVGRSGLKGAYDYLFSFPYVRMSNWPGSDWQSYVLRFGKQMAQNHGGNCHRYASLLYWFAKALGYDAKVVAGKTADGSDHGWLEVRVSDVTYICDVSIGRAYPEYNWFMIRYQDAKLKYFDLKGNRYLS